MPFFSWKFLWHVQLVWCYLLHELECGCPWCEECLEMHLFALLSDWWFDVGRGRKQFWRRDSRLARTGGSSPSLGSEDFQIVLGSCERWIVESHSVPELYYGKRVDVVQHSQSKVILTRFTFLNCLLLFHHIEAFSVFILVLKSWCSLLQHTNFCCF